MIKLIILFILFPMNIFALESTDVMKTQILKVYEKNILVLSRGAEDGIFKNDHIKLTSENGFIARGICIKNSMAMSHWKIYRVVRPELVSKDVQYNLVAIPQSRWPKEFNRISEVDFSPFIDDESDIPSEKKQVKLQQKRIAYYDLPKKTGDAEISKPRESNLDRFLSRNFSNKKLAKDLSSSYMEIYAAPYLTQTRDNQKETAYGIKFFNKAQKYQYNIEYTQREKVYTDPVTKESFEQKGTDAAFNFQLNRLTPHLSAISFIRFRSEKIGFYNYPESQYLIAPLGFKYHSDADRKATDFIEVSFAPVFDSITYDDLNLEDTTNRKGVRLLLSVYLESKFTERLGNQTTLEYAPIWDLDTDEIDYGDTNSRINTNFSYALSSNFFLNYSLDYRKDDLRSKVYNVDPDNTIQTINFKYLVSL